MFIDRQGPAMPAISAHKKPVNADWQATVAEYIERVGVTDLDDPSAPKRKTPRTDAQLRELEGIERKKAEQKAQAEHQEALARLANGTAVHRQPSDRNQVARVVKKTKVVKPKTTKVAKLKTTKVKPRKTKAKKYVKPSLTKSFKQLRTAAFKSRLKKMLKILEAGESIKMISLESAEPHATYHLQRKDIVRLSERGGEDIIRIKDINTGTSYFMFDRYKRYGGTTGAQSTAIDVYKPKSLLKALMSGDLVLVDSFEQKASYISKRIVNLAKQHGFNLFAVYKVKHLIGWVLIESSKKNVDKPCYQEAEELGGALQGLDYLKIRAEIRAKMPGASSNEINDATWTEYKRVYTDGQ